MPACMAMAEFGKSETLRVERRKAGEGGDWVEARVRWGVSGILYAVLGSTTNFISNYLNDIVVWKLTTRFKVISSD